MWRESCIARVIATAIFLSINIAVRVAGGHGCWMALGEIASMHHIITGHPPTLPSFLSFFLPSFLQTHRVADTSARGAL